MADGWLGQSMDISFSLPLLVGAAYFSLLFKYLYVDYGGIARVILSSVCHEQGFFSVRAFLVSEIRMTRNIMPGVITPFLNLV